MGVLKQQSAVRGGHSPYTQEVPERLKQPTTFSNASILQ